MAKSITIALVTIIAIAVFVVAIYAGVTYPKTIVTVPVSFTIGADSTTSAFNQPILANKVQVEVSVQNDASLWRGDSDDSKVFSVFYFPYSAFFSRDSDRLPQSPETGPLRGAIHPGIPVSGDFRTIGDRDLPQGGKVYRSSCLQHLGYDLSPRTLQTGRLSVSPLAGSSRRPGYGLSAS